MSDELGIPLIVAGVTVLLIAANSLFVFHEFAFVVLKPFQLRHFARMNTWISRTVLKAARKLDHYIAVDQLGITATSLAVGWISQPVFAELLAGPFQRLDVIPGGATTVAFIVAFLTLTMLQMIFGELIPKTIALRQPERVASAVSVPVEVFAWITHPLVVVLNGLGMAAVRAIGVQPGAMGHQQDLPAEELEAVIARSATAGEIGTDPLVVRRTLHFSELEARDIIVPRQDMVTIDLAMTVDEVLTMAREHHFTRYPVTDGSIDNIVGLLNVKELFTIDAQDQSRVVTNWHDVIASVPVLPEGASIENVLQKLVADQEQMMLLVDEFGGTGGILTVTDIAGEATGSSRDIVHLRSGAYLITGESPVSTVENYLDLSLDSGQSGYETIAGLVMAVLGRIPETGDEVVVNDARLRVQRMRGHRVTQVLLTPPVAADLLDQ